MKIESIIEDIRAICCGEIPKSNILEVLNYHDCCYLMSKIPEYSLDSMVAYALNSAAIYERFHSSASVFTMLEKYKIRYAVIKGAVLSFSAYGGIGYRHTGDIDILISRKDIECVKNVLINAGFLQGRIVDGKIEPLARKEVVFQTAMSHQLPVFIKASNNIFCPYTVIDVNTDIVWGEYGHKTNMDEFLTYTENIDICGVKLTKLVPEAEFISLCLHHYKDSNSIYLLYNGSFKLKLFSDIYFYLKNNNLDIPVLNKLFEQFNVKEYVYWCIYNADVIFNDKITKKYLSIFPSDYSSELLNTFGLAHQERHRWNISLTERLFRVNMKKYLDDVLSADELNKININSIYMQ